MNTELQCSANRCEIQAGNKSIDNDKFLQQKSRSYSSDSLTVDKGGSEILSIAAISVGGRTSTEKTSARREMGSSWLTLHVAVVSWVSLILEKDRVSMTWGKQMDPLAKG